MSEPEVSVAAAMRNDHEVLRNDLCPVLAPLAEAGIAHGGFEHFGAHGGQSLSSYGSARNTPAGATRVFLQALKALCTPAQWMHYLPVARRAAAADIWSAALAEVPSLEIAPSLLPEMAA